MFIDGMPISRWVRGRLLSFMTLKPWMPILPALKSVLARGLKLSSRDSEMPKRDSLMKRRRKQVNPLSGKIIVSSLDQIAELRSVRDLDQEWNIGRVAAKDLVVLSETCDRPRRSTGYRQWSSFRESVVDSR